MRVNSVDGLTAGHIFTNNFYALFQIKCILERILKDYININSFKLSIIPYENNDNYNQCKYNVESKNNYNIDILSYISEKQSILKDIRNRVTRSIYTYYIRQLTGLRDLSSFNIYIFNNRLKDKELFSNETIFTRIIPYLTYNENPYFWIFNSFELAILERGEEHFTIIDNKHQDIDIIKAIEKSTNIEIVRKNLNINNNIKEIINLLDDNIVKILN